MNAPVSALRSYLEDICGSAYVSSDPEVLYPYGSDQTLHLHFPFDLLVKPGSPEEISKILQYCNRHDIAVVPRGGGSGVAGAALPVQGGVVLSLERLNRILGIYNVDGYVIAEAGVVTADLCKAVEQQGLYLPVAPSSMNFSFVGGNVATNAGSIRSCRYGTTAQQVMNLEVVLPDGRIIWTGANVRKNATGVNPTQLFVGSEGTLGVITKVVYRLIPRPRTEVMLLAGFCCLEDALGMVMALKVAELSPTATELICENALQLTAAYLKERQPLVQDGINTHLLIEFQEPDQVIMDHRLDTVSAILQQHRCVDVLVATTAAEKERVSKLRYAIGEAMNSFGTTYRDVDACVPLSGLQQYIETVTAICNRHQVPLICFGHALDGNPHAMLLVGNKATQAELAALDAAADEIYAYVTTHGGVVSGEHGIGWLQKQYLPLQFDENRLSLTRQIKSMLDPGNIMNPGKAAL
ncbi:FAD-binding oxidoreductase [Chitinophaga oryzae]|uniref:FAD-binding oxidoreductase n=1 Tax=Chitinophaga oryzae TaxID=2725414 RepID=A0AAE7D7D6_9BACT|nr:FAD-binding oxidoreductase [Chitinophaga oryzae]QJB31604.1 FAD-binding oxidoreductase [Chitinophaga oryzae]